jgi:hypothetical protein
VISLVVDNKQVIKSSLQGRNENEPDYPLRILKEELQEYLPFLSVEFVVCDVCGDKLRVRDLPEHVEYVHYDPPSRVWSKGPNAGWRRGWREL